MRRIGRRQVVLVGGGLLAALLMAGCASTSTPQAREAKPSGFLGNTSQLHKGTNDESLLVYVKPGTDFSHYTKVMLDPIRIYASGPDSDLAKISKEDQQKLVNYFDAALRERLKARYQLVNQPGPDTLHLRVAITDPKGANVAMDTISSVLPIGMAISGLKSVATGASTGVGSVGAEFEALDSTTGERLAAAIDRRVGAKYTGKYDKFNKWRTAEDSFDFWANRVAMRLREVSRNPS